jgi:hypothetical protein
MDSGSKEFCIAEPGKGVGCFTAGLVLFTLIPAISVSLGARSSGGPYGPAIGCWVVIAVVDALMIWFGWSAYHIKYVIDEEGISIKGCLYGRRIERSNIFSKGFTITDLNTQGTYRPGIRTNGVGMPGFSAGWFRLANKQKGLLFVTNKSKVVCIPTLKFMLLISVENPVEFLECVKEVWGIEFSHELHELKKLN